MQPTTMEPTTMELTTLPVKIPLPLYTYMENKLNSQFHEAVKIRRQLKDIIKMALTYSQEYLRVLTGLIEK